MRKLVYGALALSAALAVGFGTGAKDAKAATEEYTFDVSGETLTITKAHKADKILVAATSLQKEDATTAYPKAIAVNAWDTYETDSDNKTIKVDLSKYSNTKDAFFLVKAGWETDNEAVLVEVPKSPSLSSAKWVLDGKIAIKDGTKQKNTVKGTDNTVDDRLVVSDDETLTYHAGESSDADKETYQLSDYGIYTYKGATLNVWLVADDTGAGAAISTYDYAFNSDGSAKATYNAFHKVKGGEAITTFKTKSRAGIPAKLTIPKQPDAPKVTVDYVNGKITVPKSAKADFKWNSYTVGTDTDDKNMESSKMKIYKTEGNNSTNKGEEATEDPYYDTNGVMKNATIFWAGAVNKAIKEADKDKNYVLDPEQVKNKFYVEVTVAGKNGFTHSKTARTAFEGKLATVNTPKTGDDVYVYWEKVAGTDTKQTTGVPVAVKLSYAGGKYSIDFYNASLTESFEIKISDKMGTTAVEKFLTLKAATKKGATGDDAKQAKSRQKVSYKTAITSSADIAANLGKTDKIMVTIRKIGDKAAMILPGVEETFAAYDSEASSAFTFHGITPDADNRLAVTLPDGYKIYAGEDSSAWGEGKSELTSAAPKAKLVVKTSTKIKIIKTGATTNVSATRLEGNVGYKFTMPSYPITIIPVFDITKDGTVTGEISTVAEDGTKTKITNDSKLKDIVTGTKIFVELKEGKKLTFTGVTADEEKNASNVVIGYSFNLTNNVTIKEEDNYSITIPDGVATKVQKSKTDDTAVSDLTGLKKDDSVYIVLGEGKDITATHADLTADKDSEDKLIGYTLKIKGTGNVVVTEKSAS